MKTRLWLVCLVALSAMEVAAEQGFPRQPLQVTSPDGKISVSFEMKTNPQPYLPGERPYYRVSYKGVPVLVDSPLGIDLKGVPALDRDFEVVAAHAGQFHFHH